MKGTLYFLLGVATGSIVTKVLIKAQYKDMAEKEIKSVIDCFKSKKNKDDAQEKTECSSGPEYNDIIRNNNYSNTEKDKKVKDKPYIIDPDEYGEFEEYEKIILTHYSDNVLADELDDVIDDVDSVVGLGYERHFGEYEADTVYVRNDAKKCDYEILYDRRRYRDVAQKPRRVKVSE